MDDRIKAASSPVTRITDATDEEALDMTEEPTPSKEALDMTEEPTPSEEERVRDYRLAAAALLFYLAIRLLPSLFPALLPAAGALHALSYLLPVTAVLLLARETAAPYLLFPKKRAFLASLPLLPLFLLAVVAAAMLSALLFPASGGDGAAEPLGEALFRHALLPAFLEESLMRLALFSLLARHTRGTAVYISAALFAIIHTPASMPYAFLGGLFLGAAALLTRSVWVPILFHFLNNAASLLLSHIAAVNAEGYPLAAAVLLTVLAIGSAVGFFFLVRRRKDPVYRPLRPLFRGGAHTAHLARATLSPLGAAALALLLFSLL